MMDISKNNIFFPTIGVAVLVIVQANYVYADVTSELNNVREAVENLSDILSGKQSAKIKRCPLYSTQQALSGPQFQNFLDEMYECMTSPDQMSDLIPVIKNYAPISDKLSLSQKNQYSKKFVEALIEDMQWYAAQLKKIKPPLSYDSFKGIEINAQLFDLNSFSYSKDANPFNYIDATLKNSYINELSVLKRMVRSLSTQAEPPLSSIPQPPQQLLAYSNWQQVLDAMNDMIANVFKKGNEFESIAWFNLIVNDLKKSINTLNAQGDFNLIMRKSKISSFVEHFVNLIVSADLPIDGNQIINGIEYLDKQGWLANGILTNSKNELAKFASSDLAQTTLDWADKQIRVFQYIQSFSAALQVFKEIIEALLMNASILTTKQAAVERIITEVYNKLLDVLNNGQNQNAALPTTIITAQLSRLKNSKLISDNFTIPGMMMSQQQGTFPPSGQSSSSAPPTPDELQKEVESLKTVATWQEAFSILNKLKTDMKEFGFAASVQTFQNVVDELLANTKLHNDKTVALEIIQNSLNDVIPGFYTSRNFVDYLTRILTQLHQKSAAKVDVSALKKSFESYQLMLEVLDKLLQAGLLGQSHFSTLRDTVVVDQQYVNRTITEIEENVAKGSSSGGGTSATGVPLAQFNNNVEEMLKAIIPPSLQAHSPIKDGYVHVTNSYFSQKPGETITGMSFKGKSLPSHGSGGAGLSLNDIFYANTPEKKKKLGEDLIGLYKIHLMPANEDQLYEVLTKIFTSGNADFFDNIVDFKVMSNILEKYKQAQNKPLSEVLKQNNEVMPIIVISPSSNKQAAEVVINTLCDILAGINGAGITPRYNWQVNSLIYYAQGHGDSKSDNNPFSSYFLNSQNRAFYNVGKFNDQLGTNLRQEDMPLKVKCASSVAPGSTTTTTSAGTTTGKEREILEELKKITQQSFDEAKKATSYAQQVGIFETLIEQLDVAPFQNLASTLSASQKKEASALLVENFLKPMVLLLKNAKASADEVANLVLLLVGLYNDGNGLLTAEDYKKVWPLFNSLYSTPGSTTTATSAGTTTASFKNMQDFKNETDELTKKIRAVSREELSEEKLQQISNEIVVFTRQMIDFAFNLSEKGKESVGLTVNRTVIAPSLTLLSKAKTSKIKNEYLANELLNMVNEMEKVGLLETTMQYQHPRDLIAEYTFPGSTTTTSSAGSSSSTASLTSRNDFWLKSDSLSRSIRDAGVSQNLTLATLQQYDREVTAFINDVIASQSNLGNPNDIAAQLKNNVLNRYFDFLKNAKNKRIDIRDIAINFTNLVYKLKQEGIVIPEDIQFTTAIKQQLY